MLDFTFNKKLRLIDRLTSRIAGYDYDSPIPARIAKRWGVDYWDRDSMNPRQNTWGEFCFVARQEFDDGKACATKDLAAVYVKSGNTEALANELKRLVMMKSKAMANSVYSTESWLLRFATAEEFLVSGGAPDLPADQNFMFKRIAKWQDYNAFIVAHGMASAGGNLHFEAQDDSAAFDLLAQALLDQDPGNKALAWSVGSVHRTDPNKGGVDITKGFFDRFNGVLFNGII